MLILIVLFVLAVVGYFVSQESRSDELEIIGSIICALSVILLVIALVSIPVNRMSARANIEGYHSIQQTLDKARGAEVLESAAFQLKVAEANQWRAGVQYWNGTVFSLWVPNAVMELEQIE